MIICFPSVFMLLIPTIAARWGNKSNHDHPLNHPPNHPTISLTCFHNACCQNVATRLQKDWGKIGESTVVSILH